jgi:hypothetical protein
VSVGWGQPSGTLDVNDFESSNANANANAFANAGLPHGDELAHHGVAKPVDSTDPLEHMFDFSAFGDDENTLFLEPTSYFEASFPSSTSSNNQQDSLTATHIPLFSPAGLPDSLGAKPFDLPADSGATSLVSDGSGNAVEGQ